MENLKVAREERTTDYRVTDYPLDLQERCGAFGPGSPLLPVDAEHEFQRGNEHELQLRCLADGADVTDAMIIKSILADLAIKHCVKTVDEQKTKIAELEDENAALKARLKQLDEMQAKDSEPATPGKRARHN